MAIIIGDPLFGSISGSIGGLNFYQFRGRQVVRTKPIPTQPHTPAQAEARARFRLALNDWQNQNYSLDKQAYADWGKSSVFRSRGLVYPLRDYQFYLGYRTMSELDPHIPPEPTEQPAERPKCPVAHPFYSEYDDKIWLWFDGFGKEHDPVYMWCTDHNHPPNLVPPKKYKHYLRNSLIFDVADDLVCELTMDDDGANPKVNDRSVNNYDFTFSDPTGNPNTNFHSRPGICHKALQFDGFDDSASRVYHADFDFARSHSFGTWIYPRAIGPDFQGIFNCVDPVAPHMAGVRLTLNIDGTLGFRVYNGNNSPSFSDTRPLNVDSWSYIGYDYLNTCYLRFYVNGVGGDYINTGICPSIPTGQTINIGVSPFGGNFFNGFFDNMRWYNRTLESQRFLALYLFSPTHHHMSPTISITYATHIPGNYQTWFKYRYASLGGGWSPLRRTYFRHTF